MKMKLVKGALCACIIALVLYGLTQLSFLQRPPTQAELEEARIFTSDDAQWFGEDPTFGVSVKLESIAADTSTAVVTVAGQTKQARTGTILLPPCLGLASILNDAVVLDQCGSYSLLASNGAAVVSIRLSADDNGLDRGTGPEAAPQIVDMRDNKNLTGLVAEYHAKLYKEPLSLVGQLKVEVRKDDSGLRHYFIYPGKDLRLFNALPLQAGDQVLAINGTPMAGKESISDIYGQLNEAGNLTVTLLRDKQELVLLLGL